ncbi:hypothetical protein GPECTOR_59g679 [Gonium pectorale]|uniref:Uncharacterized protein n=1 Tax=Gonium pectorale TaxID=33097 RepID=A0A150G6V4_GONPE|nr:hypothetical protein GPECTOR_59g679 [Gonium pectorale]|eukprot:KXZ45070.1 hypothetical protein GPECTOR_59g679 [Gonium pectorale]
MADSVDAAKRDSRRSKEALLLLREQMAVLRSISSSCRYHAGFYKQICQLRELLGAELLASGLLEHWAGLLLTVTEVHSTDAALAELRHSVYSAFADVLHDFRYCSPCAASSQLPTGPSLSFLLSCHIVSACADLGCGGGEGGTYGMPPAFRLPEGASPQSHMLSTCLSAWRGTVLVERQRLLAALETEAPAAARLAGCPLRALYRRELSLLQQRKDGEQQALPQQATKELEAARQRLELSATPPLNTTATFELCMRLAEAAMAAAAGAPKTAAGSGPSGSGSSHGQAAACGLSAKEALQLAVESLRCGRAVLAGNEALREPHLPPALAARLGRWWELYAAAVTAAACHELSAMDAAVHISEHFARLAAHPGPVAQLSADVAAALRGGCLRCLTSLFPVALRPGSESVLEAYTRTFTIYGDTWIQLLAFGETTEAVSLVAAAAEALAEHSAALTQPHAVGATESFSGATQACHFASTLFGSMLLTKLWQSGPFLLSFPSGAAGGGDAVGAPGAAAGYLPSGDGAEQLAAVASVVVARLLPEMARLLQGLLQQLHAGALDDRQLGSMRGLLMDLLRMVPWPAVGLARSSGALGEARQSADGGGGSNDDRAGSGGESSERSGGDNGSGGGDDSAAASWRQLLLVEVRLPALLGAALRLLEQVEEAMKESEGAEWRAKPLRSEPIGEGLGQALAALAAWAPAELARVVAAADRAVAGGRSGALPTTALFRSVLGRGGCRPAPELLEVVEAACGGAGQQRVPTFLPPEEWERLLQWSGLLLPPVRARGLVSG